MCQLCFIRLFILFYFFSLNATMLEFCKSQNKNKLKYKNERRTMSKTFVKQLGKLVLIKFYEV